MQLTFDRRIGVVGVIVAFSGIGVTILWPDAKWLGWLCVLLGVVGLAAWLIAEVRVAFGPTRFSRGLVGTIVVLAFLAVVLALWKAAKPLVRPLQSETRTTSSGGPNPQTPHANPRTSAGHGEQESAASRKRQPVTHPARNKTAAAPAPSNTQLITVADRVKHIVVVQLQVSPNDVNPNADLETELGGDPFDKQEILMNLEMEYKLVIPDKDAAQLHTVGDLISYIQKRTGLQ